MLFHLFSPSANGYVMLPVTGGTFAVSFAPGPRTVMDMCGVDGVSIDRGIRFGPSNNFVAGGLGTLKNKNTVTIRAPDGSFVRPLGTDVILRNNDPWGSRFVIRKLGGSGGDTIRHGDTVALGAIQPYDPRRKPSAQQCRWLQADPNDFNPSTKEVILGGLSLNPGGDSQRFTFLEGNLVLGEAVLKVSDAMPGEALPSGSLDLLLSHEGLPNGSTILVRFTGAQARSVRFGTAGSAVPPSFTTVFPIPVPRGSSAVSIPLSMADPTMADPVERFRVVGNSFTNRPEGNNLGEVTVVDSGMSSWIGQDYDGASPRAIGINGVRLQDYLRISFGGAPFSPVTDGLTVNASGPRPRLIVSSGPRRLPPFPNGRYFFAVSIAPFPAGAHANQITMAPLVDPILVLAPDGSFSRTVTFNPIPTPMSTIELYEVGVFVIPSGPPNPMRPILSRRFGLTVLP